jgi:hypothetical protein
VQVLLLKNFGRACSYMELDGKSGSLKHYCNVMIHCFFTASDLLVA